MKVIVVTLTLALSASVGVSPATSPYPVPEDHPAFDCRTMGNRTCVVIGQDDQPYLIHYAESPNGPIVDWVQPHTLPTNTIQHPTTMEV